MNEDASLSQEPPSIRCNINTTTTNKAFTVLCKAMYCANFATDNNKTYRTSIFLITCMKYTAGVQLFIYQPKMSFMSKSDPVSCLLGRGKFRRIKHERENVGKYVIQFQRA